METSYWIILLVVSMVVGYFVSGSDMFDDTGSLVLGTFFGLVISCITILVCFGVWAIIKFLFNYG